MSAQIPPDAIAAAEKAVAGEPGGWPYLARKAVEAAAPLIAAAERVEAERWKLNARRMALLAEAFVYERHRVTEGGLMAQIHRVLTDQDVEWPDGTDDLLRGDQP